MVHGYSPVRAHPRHIPWPWHALVCVLLAIFLCVMKGTPALGAGWRTGLGTGLLVVMVVLDVMTRSRYIGNGLERSMVQLVALGMSVLGIGLVFLVLPPGLPVALLVAIAVVLAGLAFVVLRWEQSVQVRRAQAIATRIREHRPPDDEG